MSSWKYKLREFGNCVLFLVTLMCISFMYVTTVMVLSQVRSMENAFWLGSAVTVPPMTVLVKWAMKVDRPRLRRIK